MLNTAYGDTCAADNSTASNFAANTSSATISPTLLLLKSSWSSNWMADNTLLNKPTTSSVANFYKIKGTKCYVFGITMYCSRQKP